MIDPLVHHDVINRGALSGIVVKYFSDQVAGIVANWDTVWELISIHTNPFVCRLDIGGLKRRLAND